MEDKRTRAQAPPLDPRAVVIMRKLAGDFADRYAQDFLLGHIRKVLNLPDADRSAIAEALEDPEKALIVFFAHYAFARRGKDREELAELAVQAMKRLVEEKPFSEVLDMADGTLLWEKFALICEERKRKSNEQQNRGPVQGMLELAQEIHRIDPELSLATWLIEGVESTGRLEPQHTRIVDIRGVGPKSASTFLRDMVWVYDAEEEVEAADRLFVQPVDRWLRLIVKYVVPEPDLDDPADWIVAGKISKYARRAGVSGISFNMGTTYFGQRIVGNPAKFADGLRDILLAEVENIKARSAQEPDGDRPESN